MKRVLLTTSAIVFGAFYFGTPVYAAPIPLVADGISYTLTMQNTTNPLIELFTLAISGINVPVSGATGDTEGGRSGVNSISFGLPSQGLTNAQMITPPSGWVFQFGGLNSTGCNGKDASQYCFDNVSIPPTPPNPLAVGS